MLFLLIHDYVFLIYLFTVRWMQQCTARLLLLVNGIFLSDNCYQMIVKIHQHPKQEI